jgi:hypothetical protein
MTSDDIATTISDFRHAAKMLSKRVQMVSSCWRQWIPAAIIPVTKRATTEAATSTEAPPKTARFD